MDTETPDDAPGGVDTDVRRTRRAPLPTSGDVPARPRERLRELVRPGRALHELVFAAAVAGVCVATLAVADLGPLPTTLSASGAAALLAWHWFATRHRRTLAAELDALRRQEERFRLLVQNSYDVVTISQVDGTITYMSGGSQRMFGRRPGQRLGANILELIHPEDRDRVARHFDEVAATPDAFVLYQCRFRHADGTWRWIEILSTNLLNEPSVRGIVCNTRDITETRQLQDQLSHDASHDVLTGLANRALYRDDVEKAVASVVPGVLISVVLVDLDDFKTVNDTLGHGVGDRLLVEVAERMRRATRDGDTVARLGGDEFALIVHSATAADVDVLLTRIRTAVREPVEVDGHRLSVGASFGIAEARLGDSAGELLRRADIAMYEAKAGGTGDWVRYEPGMEARGAERARLTAELRRAVDDGELRLHYQPVVSLPGGDLLGVEALVRWQHPTRGLLPPGEFIPAAEDDCLIVAVGRWVLREACRQAAAWLREHGPAAPQTMSVNVSARQLHEPGFVAEVAAALGEHGLPADRLVVEITESVAVRSETAWSALRGLRELGVRVSLDDFGTGQSALSLLASCQVDQIKLDRSFAPGPGPETVATAVVQVARALGIEAVAEGVETPAQADRLHALGFDRAQGFHFARPMPATDIDAALAHRYLLRAA